MKFESKYDEKELFELMSEFSKNLSKYLQIHMKFYVKKTKNFFKKLYLNFHWIYLVFILKYIDFDYLNYNKK